MDVTLDEISILQCMFFQELRLERSEVDFNNLLDCAFFNGKVVFAYECGLLTEHHKDELFICIMD